MPGVITPNIIGTVTAGNAIEGVSNTNIQDSGIPVGSSSSINIIDALTISDRDPQTISGTDTFINTLFGPALAGDGASVDVLGEITISKEGSYLIEYSDSPNQSSGSGATSSELRVLKNGIEYDVWVDVLNTVVNWSIPASRTILLQLAVGDTLEFQRCLPSSLSNNNDFRLAAWNTSSTPSAFNASYSAQAIIKRLELTATLSNPLSLVAGTIVFNNSLIIDDNDYYTLEFDAVENWWKFIPKALMNGLTTSGSFALERPGRTVDTFNLVAVTGVDIWINNGSTVNPPGAAGKYNAADENRLNGYFLVQDTIPFFRGYALNATENTLVMYNYFKEI